MFNTDFDNPGDEDELSSRSLGFDIEDEEEEEDIVCDSMNSLVGQIEKEYYL